MATETQKFSTDELLKILKLVDLEDNRERVLDISREQLREEFQNDPEKFVTFTQMTKDLGLLLIDFFQERRVPKNQSVIALDALVISMAKLMTLPKAKAATE